MKNGNASKICGSTSKKEETSVADTEGVGDIRPPPNRFREGLSPPLNLEFLFLYSDKLLNSMIKGKLETLVQNRKNIVLTNYI